MFISLTWTAGINEVEARILAQTIAGAVTRVGERIGLWFQSQALPTIHPYGDWIIPAMPHGSAYSSLDWYLARCRTPDGERLDGPAYLRLVQVEPWQSSTPHLDVALVSQDLIDSEGQSVLNVALPGLAAVASLYQLRELDSQDVQDAGLRHLVAHVFGRAVGIPRGRLPRAGGGDQYCTNRCAMRPCTQLRELLEYSTEGDPSRPYCQACERDLTAVLVGLHFGLN
jgi:hypothetical protein